MTIGRRRRQGQILVLSAILMTFFFVPVAVLVVDTGLLQAGYAQLTETVQAAAEDGASMLNEDLYRSTQGKVVQLDPDRARAVAMKALTVGELAGLGPGQVSVRGNLVTVRVSETIRLFLLGSATITVTKSARLTYGA